VSSDAVPWMYHSAFNRAGQAESGLPVNERHCLQPPLVLVVPGRQLWMKDFSEL
jgi:hypothetical protein